MPPRSHTVFQEDSGFLAELEGVVPREGEAEDPVARDRYVASPRDSGDSGDGASERQASSFVRTPTLRVI